MCMSVYTYIYIYIYIYWSGKQWLSRDLTNVSPRDAATMAQRPLSNAFRMHAAKHVSTIPKTPVWQHAGTIHVYIYIYVLIYVCLYIYIYILEREIHVYIYIYIYI